MELKDVTDLAATARLELAQEEQESLLHDLTAIIGYVDQVMKTPVSNARIEAGAGRNSTRDDVVTTVTGSYTASLLEQAVEVKDGYIKVIKIL